MDLGISGRVALVGASGRGLGRATAERLAMEGAHVALCDINEEVLDEASRIVQAAGDGATVRSYQVDLRNRSEIEGLVKNVRNDLGPISILITNAGGPPAGTFEDASDEKWAHTYELTFLSAVRMIRASLPDMKNQRWGRIINFTSRALKAPIPGLMLSNAMRLAVGGMAKTLAGEVATYGITVNNICPGTTLTDRAVDLAGRRAEKKGISLEEELERVASTIPMGRLGEPHEPAAAAAFLASELAGYITGVSLLVDGGTVKAL